MGGGGAGGSSVEMSCDGRLMGKVYQVAASVARMCRRWHLCRAVEGLSVTKLMGRQIRCQVQELQLMGRQIRCQLLI